ncbi:MAG: LytR/AlgR family response regulator transcription factor [Flavisolibacter sp.]|jgi:DNA-binding LytR/AlgR family response regulator
MKLKCLLVDDEPPALQILEKYVAAVEQLELVASCANAFAAIDIIRKKKVDLIFLDIHMPKLTGTGFVKTLQHPPKIIFTTAYKEFALDAFELDAVDYLLKPISFERFFKAVNKLIQNDSGSDEEEIENTSAGFLYFRADRKMVKIFLDEISYVESLKDYVKIHRIKEKPLLVKQSISTLEAMLPQNMFVRIHRSYIVSISKIKAFTYHDVEIENTELPIGRMYSSNVQRLSVRS